MGCQVIAKVFGLDEVQDLSPVQYRSHPTDCGRPLPGCSGRQV